MRLRKRQELALGGVRPADGRDGFSGEREGWLAMLHAVAGPA
jgi:hypothetical protein